MSGKPYPEGVTRVLRDLARCEELDAVMNELAPLVEKLKAAREESAQLRTGIAKALEQMDLEAQHNYGFGGRMGWFVAEMRRQLVAELSATPSRVTETDR